MGNLRIPFALNTAGELCSPKEAKEGEAYFCPGCGAPVTLRRGPKMAAHFAHRPGVRCDPDRVVHRTAGLLVQRVVRAWKAGQAPAPLVRRRCRACHTPVLQPLPDRVHDALLECRLPEGSVADVALVDEKGHPLAAVELDVIWPAEAGKGVRLPVPFVVLAASAVVEDPAVWDPISDHFRPLICGRCKAAFRRFLAKARRIAQATGVELPTAYYRYGITTCWKCKREILVFTWPGKGLHGDAPPRVRPMPRTVQYRYSKTVGGRYWANTCPYCRALQGDFFLYGEPDGPFFGLYIEETPPEADGPTAFRLDLIRIAAYAAQTGNI